MSGLEGGLSLRKKNNDPKSVEERFSTGLKLLKKYYPEAHCALNHRNPFELLVATILSAQCTDERVNMVTPHLFDQFPTPEKMAKASLPQLEQLIRSTGFYKNKAKNLKQASIDLVSQHGGKIPQNLEALVALAGVGRKTANVVLGNAFNIASGVVVDTHVSRLSQRLGWTRQTTPEKIEKDLMKLCPEKDWVMLSHYLISHGRSVCKARSPQCQKCFLAGSSPRSLCLFDLTQRPA